MNREELIELRKQVQKVIENGWEFPSSVLSAQIMLVFEQAHTPTEECNCAPGPDGVVIHNSWAHEQAHTPTGLKPHTAYTVRVNGGESVTLTTLGEPTDDEREALRIAELDARQAAHRQDRVDWWVDHEHEPEITSNAFFRGWDAASDALRRTVQGEYRGATPPDAGERADVRALVQGEPTDAPKQLAFEVNQMLSSVASHGPAALTTTSDPMYTADLLRRLRDVVDPAPRQYVAASDAVRAVMARHGLEVHRMVYGQPIASVLAREALQAALRAAAATREGENRG